ncbi:Hypothetical protein NTJ_01042 [Nesidiocoris tenuis]|uniref:Uncharacterized protein n=1 Tax=Nesidiocoris tenuis TaxID=355587 RepID=A0ABN7A7I5_9HEMI|nr:Hypothetical protein NTJ_01042 [Nesidiocoris tenuis]
MASSSEGSATKNEDKSKTSFRGPEGGPKKYDLDKLKKLQIHLEVRKRLPENDASTSSFDPGLITPVRRPDEGKVPLFAKITTQSDEPEDKSDGLALNAKPRTAKSSDREEHRKPKKSRRSRSRSRTRSDRPRRSDRRYRDCLSGRDYLLRLQREALRKKYERRRRERQRRRNNRRSRSRSRSSSSSSSGSSSDRSRSRSRSSRSRSRSASSGSSRRSRRSSRSRDRRRRSGSRRSKERSGRQVIRLDDRPDRRPFQEDRPPPFRPMMPMRPMYPPFMRPHFMPGPPMPFFPGAPMMYPVPFRPFSAPPLRGGPRGRRP